MAFGYNPEEIVLTPEEEEAARQAAAGSTPPPASPPPYDPAQDTQGMQAQPNTITLAPTATEAAKSPEASYAYRQAAGSPSIDTGTAPPESTQQTITEPVPDPPPPYTPPLHPYDDWHNYEAPPPTEAPRTSILGPLQTPADALWKALDMRFSIGDPAQRYQDAESAYATGRETAPLHKRGEGWVQTLVDLEHSGLGKFLGGAYGAAQERNAAIAKELEPQTPYGPPPDQGYAAQVTGAGTGERMPGPAGQDTSVPFAGSDRSIPTERIRRKVGSVGSWYDTPTAAGSMGAPPPDNPNRGQTDLLQGILGGGRALATYGPGTGTDITQVLLDNLAPYDPERVARMTEPGNPSNPRTMPDWLRWSVGLGRDMLFDDPAQTPYDPQAGGGGPNPMDTTDAYLGNDPEYLRRMASMPEYMTALRPLAARAAHVVRALPGPSWQPPYMEGFAPEPGVDAQEPGTPREHYLHPEAGLYYDDPYIPGPDKGPRRRIA